MITKVSGLTGWLAVKVSAVVGPAADRQRCVQVESPKVACVVTADAATARKACIARVSAVTMTLPEDEVSDVETTRLKQLDPIKGHNEARELYELEEPAEKTERRKKVEIAKRLAIELREEVERLDALNKKYAQVKWKTLIAQAGDRTDAEAVELKEVAKIKKQKKVFIPKGTKTTLYKKFRTTLEYFLERKNATEILEDTDLVALIAYHYSINYLNGLLDNFTSRLPDKKELFAKHLFFDIWNKSTASDMETLRTLPDEINNAKLQTVLSSPKPRQFAELVCRGCTEGLNPPVRDWGISYSGKYRGVQGKDLINRQMAWILEFGEKVVTRRKSEGIADSGAENVIELDLNKIRQINWTTTLYDYGLRPVVEIKQSNPDALTSVDAIRLGLEQIGGDKLAESLPRYYVTRINMWTEEDASGGRLIDDVTDDVIELLRKAKPELFKDSGKGRLIPEEARTFDGWHAAYNALAPECLKFSGLNLFEGLKRRHSYAFGFARNQVKEWEMAMTGKWEDKRGTQGKTLFRQALMYNVHESGLGHFFIEDNTLYYTFTLDEFDEWYKREVGAKYNNDLREFITRVGLSGGMRQIANYNVRDTIKILFDMDDSTELPTLSVRRTDLIREIIKAILRKQNDIFKAPVADISSEEKALLVSDGAQVVRSKANIVAAALSAKVNNPFGSGFIAFVPVAAEAQLLSDSLARFDTDRTSLDRLFRQDETRFPLYEMADILVASRVADGLGCSSAIETLLTAREPLYKKRYLLTVEELKNTLTVVQDVLGDVNLEKQLRDELRLHLSEIAALPGNFREKVGIVTKACLQNGQSSEATEMDVLTIVLNHVAQSIVLKSIHDKAFGGTPSPYNFEAIQNTVKPVCADKTTYAKAIALKIKRDREKAESLLSAYNSKTSEEMVELARGGYSSKDQSGRDFADVLLRIAKHKAEDKSGIELLKRTTTHDQLCTEITKVSERLSLPFVKDDVELESVVAWHLLKKRNSHKTDAEGFLEEFPAGFLKPNDRNFYLRLATLVSYALAI